jgi:hypothetical protein
MAEKKGQTIVETAVEARGAERGPTVRNVLVWLRRLSASDMATSPWLDSPSPRSLPVFG